MIASTRKRLPDWFRYQLPRSSPGTNKIIRKYHLNTVCESALCPNCTECYSRATATFMILGNICTRRCSFCAVKHGNPLPIDASEPARVAQAAKELGLRYVVITSVTRDDCDDEGAQVFADTIRALRSEIPGVQIEVLTPDFHARKDLIEIVVKAKPDVYNHNLETVDRLQKDMRPQASYERSLAVIEIVKKIDPSIHTKSGIMLGLGETEAEIFQTARDLLKSGCEILTIGQYLAPSQAHAEIAEYKTPGYFEDLGKQLLTWGFRKVFSGPQVRSSYHAGEFFLNY